MKMSRHEKAIRKELAEAEAEITRLEAIRENTALKLGLQVQWRDKLKRLIETPAEGDDTAAADG